MEGELHRINGSIVLHRHTGDGECVVRETIKDCNQQSQGCEQAGKKYVPHPVLLLTNIYHIKYLTLQSIIIWTLLYEPSGYIEAKSKTPLQKLLKARDIKIRITLTGVETVS
jgi:hypothetical protein